MESLPENLLARAREDAERRSAEAKRSAEDMRAKLAGVTKAAERLRSWFGADDDRTDDDTDDGNAHAPGGGELGGATPTEMMAMHAAVVSALLAGVRDESIASALGFAGSPSSGGESSGLSVVRTIARQALAPDLASLAMGWRVEQALALLVGAGDSDLVRELRAVLLDEPFDEEATA